MDMPVNQFKRGLKSGPPQCGCWLSLASVVATEICAGAGFDWLLIDTEHAPNELHMVHAQILAASAYPVPILVRPAWNDTVILKRLLDLGVQSFVVPYVQNAEEAARAVAATRYPPKGVRGVSVSSRSSRFGRVKDYLPRADDEICVIVQIESREGLNNIEAIAAVEGVDGLFIGPQDLAADLGHLGNPSHSDVQAAIADALTRMKKAGKAPCILSFAEADSKKWIAHGARMVAVTSDLFLLAKESTALAARFKNP
jgi:4-hydroxy-2-oxoheptanedioate aldolase